MSTISSPTSSRRCARDGDAAVIALTQQFDRIDLTPDTLRITAAEVDAAVRQVSAEDCAALELAATRIRDYHARQLPEDAEWTDAVGATLGLALDGCVGCGSLCARRACQLSVVCVDERDTSQGCRGGASGDGGADT